MTKEDYYSILGVSRDVDKAALKAAYRKLAMQYHPDRNPDDKQAEQRFKDVNEAYEVLKDGQKRAAYDQFGHAGVDPNNSGGRSGGFEFSGGFSDIFDEMFGDVFSGGRRRAGPKRGADLRHDMEISLSEAFSGKTTTLRLGTLVSCETCHGSGGKDGAQPVTCTTCRGQGKVRAQQGFFTIERTCHRCGGRGQMIQDPCPKCDGSGRVRHNKELKVTIPAGIEDGARIRLAHEGEAGDYGAPSGDLYIFISVRPHRIFQRDGANIYCRVPIPMVTAALGGSIEVPTIDGGRARVTVPVGTQVGQQFRLKNKGMSVLKSSVRGDMFIEALVETPTNLSKKQKEILRMFDSEGSQKSNSPESEGFFAKVKDLWEDLKD